MGAHKICYVPETARRSASARFYARTQLGDECILPLNVRRKRLSFVAVGGGSGGGGAQLVHTRSLLGERRFAD
jgi:hypothetical protein